LEETRYQGYVLKNAPEKVLQFGEGNFLRAFVNYWFDIANEKAGWNGKCVLVQPIAQGLTDLKICKLTNEVRNDITGVFVYRVEKCDLR
jgi:mannitol-1-phosphate/altronate dehydrogenase